MSNKLVIGLGNPGPKYEHTWHNLGFRVVRELSSKLKCSFKSRKDALAAQATARGRKITLLQPQSYMNLSGIPAARWAKKLKIEYDDILVILDDHDLPSGLLRIRESGGDGGHRGLGSILDVFGDNVPRLRIGIRDEEIDPESGGYADLAGRVLSTLDPREELHVQHIVALACDAALDWINNGISSAMNRYNNKRISPSDLRNSDG
ncbi:aminoacyl-tRNA hydrolase [Calditrichota bacterium]